MKETKCYVVSKGLLKTLYIENPGLYKIMPTMVENIIGAKMFATYEEAEKIANKVNGKVEEIKIIPSALDEETQTEIDMLKAANKQLIAERDEAIKKLEEREKIICQK